MREYALYALYVFLVWSPGLMGPVNKRTYKMLRHEHNEIYGAHTTMKGWDAEPPQSFVSSTAVLHPCCCATMLIS